MRKLLLRQGIQNIALIFRRIQCFFQNEFAVLPLDACIMPRHEAVAAENPCALVQGFKLHIAVAVNTRIRRTSHLIALDEFSDHRLAEDI